MPTLTQLLDQAAAFHRHLCPRQVLGVRIGLAGLGALGLTTAPHDKRLLVIVETDGCFVTGIEVATGAAVRHRTLRIVDYGKVAAVFVDMQRERTVRVAPRLDVRRRAYAYAPGEPRRYFAQLQAYQCMPVEELLTVQNVKLVKPIKTIVSRSVRTACVGCGEEIINEREVIIDGQPHCLSCTYGGYYVHTVEPRGIPAPLAPWVEDTAAGPRWCVMR